MIKIKRILSILILIIFMLLITPKQIYAASNENTISSENTLDNISSKIESFVLENKDTTAGMAVSVFNKSSFIYKNYFGHSDIENQVKVNQDTVFEWGSITKILVWVSVMQLWEQGKLDLNTDIQHYLPSSFLKNLKYDTPVTMLNLMNHNAGFEDSFVNLMTSNENYIQSLEDYLINIQPKQIFVPGEITAYSNWGVALAGYIVQQISGIPFYEYVHKNIFNPLQMRHSALNADLSDNAWVRQQWDKLKCYTINLDLIEQRSKYIIMYPAGMCTSTLSDFATFGQALLNRESPLFKDPNTYDFFMTPSSYFGDTDIPLNYHGIWAIRAYNIPIIGHGGNTSGSSSYVLLDLQNGIGMTVMTNQKYEVNYNRNMPELLFGKYQGEKLNFTGYLMTARTIFRGPFKLQKLVNIIHITPEDTESCLCTISKYIDGEKLTQPYGDFIVKQSSEVILLYLPFILWILSLIFCMINLIVHAIIFVIKKIRHKNTNFRIKKWSFIACILQLLTLIPLILAITSLLSLNLWAKWQYKLVFSTFIIWPIVYALLIFLIIKEIFKRKKINLYSIINILSLIISIFNIIFWELGSFWMI